MLLVKTKIGPSKIHGIGCFADQFIPKGTDVWRFQPGFDLEIDEGEIANLSELAKEGFLRYTYLDRLTNKYIFCSDDDRFVNHSDNPNCINIYSFDGSHTSVAAKDIQEGEELTEDYEVYDANFESLDFVKVKFGT